MRRTRVANALRHRRLVVPALIAAAIPASPAHAAFGTSFDLASEERFRGRPVSSSRPTGTLALSYDIAGGAYLGASATAVLNRGPRLELLGLQQQAGYARRLGGGLTADVGVVFRSYTRAFSGGFSANFVEAYAGLAGRRAAARVFVSPSYYGRGRPTIYVSLDGVVYQANDWRATVHAGGLAPLGGPETQSFGRSAYDWSVALNRRLGRIDAQLAYTGAGPRADFYRGTTHGRGAVVLRLSRSF